MTVKPGPTRRTERILLLLGVLVLAGVGAWLLFLEPEEGGSAADILGMVLTGVGVIVAIMLRPARPAADGSAAGSAVAVRTPLSPAQKRRRIIYAAVLVVLLGGLGGTVWRYTTTSAITVTGTIEVRGHERMGDGDTATIVVPGQPPKRAHITLVPVITNTAATGDCVDPARLVVTPVVDGRPGPSTVVRSGEPARVSIAGAAREVVLQVVVDQSAGDPSCRVNLRIDRAYLHG
jgi:hypothetical protein